MPADTNFWKAFDPYGNAASVASFVIAIVGLIVSGVGILLQMWTREAVNEAKREVERARQEARKQLAGVLKRLALQVLASEIEQVLRYNKEALVAGESGQWLRAKDRFADAKTSSVEIAENPHLTPNEIRDVRSAIDNLEVIDRMIDAEKRKRGATRSFPDPSRRKLNEIEATLGRIRGRIATASLEVPNV